MNNANADTGYPWPAGPGTPEAHPSTRKRRTARTTLLAFIATLTVAGLLFGTGISIGMYMAEADIRPFGIGVTEVTHYGIPIDDIVITDEHRTLEQAVGEDLGFSLAEWDTYGAEVRPAIERALAAGADPDQLRVHDNGTVSLDGTNVQLQAEGLKLDRTAPPVAETYGTGGSRPAESDNPDWNCSTGLPVTVSHNGTGGFAEQVWLTAAHCLNIDEEPQPAHPRTISWYRIFGDGSITDAEGLSAAPAGMAGRADQSSNSTQKGRSPDYAVTRRSTIIDWADTKAHPSQGNHHLDGVLPPVRGLKTCAPTIYGWRCGEIAESTPEIRAEGVVASTMYATPGVSGSISSVGGAAVFMTNWYSGYNRKHNGHNFGHALGYAITHVIDDAAAEGWDVHIGWRERW